MKTVFPFLVLWLAAGCASPSLEPLPDDHAPGLAGFWYIDQPMHALYEATIYRFHPDGRLEAVDAWPDGYRTGSVGTRDLSIGCEFAGPWQSEGNTILTVGLRCSDGQDREALLRFPEGFDACQGEPGCFPLVDSVDGDTENWTRHGFEWMWTRCVDETDCRARLRLWSGG